MKKKEINIFNISFLDLISGALGAVIILFITVSKGHLSQEVLENKNLSNSQKKILSENSSKIIELEKKIEELKRENSKILQQLNSNSQSEDSKISTVGLTVKSIFKNIFSKKQNFSNLEIMESTTLENVYFYPGTTTFLPGYKNTLEALISYLSSNNVRIEVQGHIHWPKSSMTQRIPKSAIKLSEERAQKVCDYLVANKIAKERLVCIGLGAQYLKTLTDNDDEGSENRRIEIKVIE